MALVGLFLHFREVLKNKLCTCIFYFAKPLCSRHTPHRLPYAPAAARFKAAKSVARSAPSLVPPLSWSKASALHSSVASRSLPWEGLPCCIWPVLVQGLSCLFKLFHQIRLQKGEWYCYIWTIPWNLIDSYLCVLACGLCVLLEFYFPLIHPRLVRNLCRCPLCTVRIACNVHFIAF